MMTQRIEKKFLTCPACGRTLMKCDGTCNIEVTCNKCNRGLSVHVDPERITIQEDRRLVARVARGSAALKKNLDNNTGMEVPVVTI